MVGLGVYFVTFKQKKQNLNPIHEEIFYRVVKKAKNDILTRWKEGDIEGLFKKGLFNCSRIPNDSKISQKYFQCNPEYFNCFLSGKIKNLEPKFKISLNDKVYHLTLDKTLEYTNQSITGITIPGFDGYITTVKVDEIPGFSLSLLLKNNCHQAKLPERIYALNPKNTEELWDNFERVIKIDKFQVNNREINQWVHSGKGDEHLLIQDAKQLHLPATHLNREQMRKYCSFRGKQLLKSHIFDAAVFFPNAPDNPNNKFIKLYPYPWTKKRKIKNTINESNCGQFYSSECREKFDYDPYSSLNVSWMGIYQVMGGYPEYVENIIDPELNIALSSYYFERMSDYNNLFARGIWNGESGKSLEIQIPKLRRSRERFKDKIDWKGVAFRCMQNI